MNNCDAGAPSRLCGQVYGAGSCCQDFNDAKRIQFKSLLRRVHELTYHARPKPDALDGVLQHTRMFRIAAKLRPGEAAPSALPVVVALLMFSLKVDGYLRQVWLRLPALVDVAADTTISAIWSRTNLCYDQCIAKHVMEWGKPIEIHHLTFELRNHDLRSLHVTSLEVVPEKQDKAPDADEALALRSLAQIKPGKRQRPGIGSKEQRKRQTMMVGHKRNKGGQNTRCQ